MSVHLPYLPRWLLPLAVGLCFTAWLHGAAAQPKPNAAYCEATGANLVFVIDTTTAYDDKDKELLVGAMLAMFEILRGGDRMLVRTITDTFSTSHRVVERCIPHCAARGMFDKLFSCSEGLILAETKKAKRDIVAALRAHLVAVRPRNRSDIARTLSSIAREDARGRTRNIFYIFSDMIENSDHVSGRAFFSVENKRLLTHMKKFDLVARLKGAEVHVFGFGRDGTEARLPLQIAAQQKLSDFWRKYFKSAGANLIEMGQNIVVRR